MMKPTLLLLAGILALSACNKKNEETKDPIGICGNSTDGDFGCPINIVCTMDFKAIFVTVTESGQPMHLDAYKTVRIWDGKEYVLNVPGSQEDISSKANGNYPVLTDSQRKDTGQPGCVFEFRGYKNGVLVVKESYTIGNDCCHINLLSGKTEINN